MIVTNPPFGGMEEDGIENNFPAEFRTRETADLFLVLVMELLKDGGRAAIVLPDGTLFGEGIKTRIKKQLLEECNLHTIVRLPKGVFAPYTTIKTNILFFTKGEPTKDVWFYEHPYPDGYKSYSKTKPMRIEEFEPEKAWWDNREENERAWKVTGRRHRRRWLQPRHHEPQHGRRRPRGPRRPPRPLRRSQRRGRDRPRGAPGEPRRSAAGEMMDTEAFLDNFGTIADSPGGFRRLRDLALDLAIHGRLTMPKACDQPIGKVLNSSGLEPIHGAYGYPSRWPLARLGDIAEVRLGRQRSPSKATGDRMRPYLRAANVGWDGLRLDEVKEMAFTKSESDSYELWPGDLLLGEASGSPSEVGKPAQYRGEIPGCCFQNTLIRVRFADPLVLLPDFYERYFRQQARSGAFAKSSRGVAINHLGSKTLAEWTVPVPPPAEQERIVAKADELLRLCDHLEAVQDRRRRAATRFRASALNALTEADTVADLRRAWERASANWPTLTDDPDSIVEFRPVVLQLAVEGRLVARRPEEGVADDVLALVARERHALVQSGTISKPKASVIVDRDEAPFDVPDHWTWVHVEDVCTHIVDCLHRTPPYAPSGYPAIRTCDVEPGRVLVDQALRVDDATYRQQTARLTPKAGDVLYSREGGRYGIAAVVPPHTLLCLSQRMMQFRCASAVVPEYFAWFLNSPLGFGQATQDVGGSASPHVNIRSIRRFLMPLPPTGEQHRIVRQIERLDEQRQRLERAVNSRSRVAAQFASAVSSTGLSG